MLASCGGKLTRRRAVRPRVVWWRAPAVVNGVHRQLTTVVINLAGLRVPAVRNLWAFGLAHRLHFAGARPARPAGENPRRWRSEYLRPSNCSRRSRLQSRSCPNGVAAQSASRRRRDAQPRSGLCRRDRDGDLPRWRAARLASSYGKRTSGPCDTDGARRARSRPELCRSNAVTSANHGSHLG